MEHPIATLDIRTQEEGILAQQRMRRAADLLGLDPYEQTRIVTAVAELVREAEPETSGAAIGLVISVASGDAGGRATTRAGGEPARLEARFRLPRAVAKRLRQALRDGGPADAPPGIVAARRVVDGLTIDDDRDPAEIVLWKQLPAAAPGPARLEAIAAALEGERGIAEGARGGAAAARAEAKRLEREIERREQMISALRQELEDTNRGVVSLYAELDERAEYQRRAADLKSRILSDMGHELRTPIHSILSISQFLLQRLDGDLNAEQEKQVRIVRNTARDLAQLIDDLLDLAKAEAGKIPVRPGSFTAPQLFNTLRGMFRPLAAEAAVPLIFDEAADLPPLVTDESKLSQILRNLISNALKFTEEGEVRVTAALGAGSDLLSFSVIDTGVGIATRDHERIFEEFAQLDSPTLRRTKGTGLGLPLARRLATLLGGTLSVQSALGAGSTFTVTIPRILPDAAEPQASPGGAARADEPTPLAHRLRAVIVDDEEASRYVLRLYLGSAFSVVEADNGATGLEAVRALLPHVVFLDLRMPGRSGFDVLAALKDDAATRAIPVIIWTSQTALTDAERERLTPAAAILSKVRFPEDGERLLAEALASAGLIAPAAAGGARPAAVEEHR